MLVLNNRTFVDNDTIKASSLQFINDSVCIYEQKFLCDIDKPFKETKIVAHYETFKKKIILRNMTMHSDSINATCFSLPESEIKKCNFFNEVFLKPKYILAGAPGSISKADIYGYINNITKDTLSYKRGTIYYSKWNNCVQYPLFITISFTEKK